MMVSCPGGGDDEILAKGPIEDAMDMGFKVIEIFSE